MIAFEVYNIIRSCLPALSVVGVSSTAPTSAISLLQISRFLVVNIQNMLRLSTGKAWTTVPEKWLDAVFREDQQKYHYKKIGSNN